MIGSGDCQLFTGYRLSAFLVGIVLFANHAVVVCFTTVVGTIGSRSFRIEQTITVVMTGGGEYAVYNVYGNGYVIDGNKIGYLQIQSAVALATNSCNQNIKQYAILGQNNGGAVLSGDEYDFYRGITIGNNGIAHFDNAIKVFRSHADYFNSSGIVG